MSYWRVALGRPQRRGAVASIQGAAAWGGLLAMASGQTLGWPRRLLAAVVGRCVGATAWQARPLIQVSRYVPPPLPP